MKAVNIIDTQSIYVWLMSTSIIFHVQIMVGNKE